MTTNLRIGTTSNLPTGATYDLLVVKFPNGFPESAITFDIDDTPRKITGIQKVAQTFLKVLFTTRGSNVIVPTQGTNFSLLTVNANRTGNDSIFTSELVTEVKSAESQVRTMLNTLGSDPASQLREISILGLDTDKESVIMYLRLVTGAGALAQVAVPFPQLDMSLSQE